MGKRVDLGNGCYKVIHEPQDYPVAGTDIHVLGTPDERIILKVGDTKVEITEHQALQLAGKLSSICLFFDEDYGY